MTDEKNELEALLESAHGDAEKIDAFYREMMEADLFVLSDEGLSQHAANEDENEAAGILHFIDEDNKPFIPVFTSLGALQKSIDREYGFLAFRGRDLLAMAEDARIIINPQSDMAIHLESDDVQALLARYAV